MKEKRDEFLHDEEGSARTYDQVLSGEKIAITENENITKEGDLERNSLYLKGIVAGAFSQTTDDDDAGWSDISGSARIGGIPMPKDRLKKIQDASMARYLSDPIYAGLVDAFKFFTIGKGIHVTAKDEAPEVQEYLDEFIKVNSMDGRDRDIVSKSLKAGEIFIRKFTKGPNNESAEMPKIRFLNHYEITDIIKDPKDNEKVISYVRTHADSNNPGSTTTETIPAKDIIHIKMGAMDDYRGLPPFMVVSQMCFYYSDWLANRIVFNRLKTAYYLEEIVEGTPSNVSSVDGATPDSNKTGLGGKVIKRMPKIGSKLTHNKAVTYKWLSPDVKADSAKEDGRAMRMAICAGAQCPEFILGDASQSNYACFDEKTDVLTNRGWLKYYEIASSDTIATVNKKTRNVVYQKMDAFHVYPYDGEMIHFKNQRDLDLMVTPNHRMYVTRHQLRRHGGRSGPLIREGIKPWKFVTADDVANSGSTWLMFDEPNGASDKINPDFILPALMTRGNGRNEHIQMDREIPSDVWTKFLGYWLSEGWVIKNAKKYHYAIGLSQKTGPIADKIRMTLSSMPNVKWTEYKKSTEIIEWRANDKGLHNYLSKNCGIGAMSKKMPCSISTLNKGTATMLVDSLVDGDGSRRNGQTHYFTKSNQLADDVMATMLSAGMKPRSHPPMSNGVIPVSVGREERNKIIDPKKDIHRVPYKGIVWCVSVPNETMITRRNGRVSITGNSSLVSQNPFVRKIEWLQDFYEAYFKEIFEWAIAHGIKTKVLPSNSTETVMKEKAAAVGLFRKMKKMFSFKEQFDQKGNIVIKNKIQTKTEVDIQWPNLIASDILKDSKAYQIHQAMGVVSDETISQKLGYEYEEEMRKMEKQESEKPEPEEEPFGGDERDDEINRPEPPQEPPQGPPQGPPQTPPVTPPQGGGG